MASTERGRSPCRQADGLQILQSAIVLLVAPLYAGVLTRAEAIVQSKRGPSVLQPYRDLAKLLRKGSAISEHASWIFRGAPFVAFACYLTVSAIVPIITDEPLPLAFLADLIGGAFVLALASFAISLAALDTASPLGGLGSSRTTWIGSLAEPALILVFFTVAALSQSDNPYLENHTIAHSGAAYVLPTHLLGAVAFFMLVLAENGRIPIDNPSGDDRDLDDRGEPRARVLGPRVRARQVGELDEAVPALVDLHERVRDPVGARARDTIARRLPGIGALLGKLAVCGLVIVVIDSSFAKLRFFRIAEFLGASFLLALIGIATSYVIGK